MASTIKIKNSSTAGAVPGTGDLVQGELAINVTDRRIFTENASGTVVELGTPSIDDNGNATAITIDSSENVGIGTSSPAFALDIGSAASNIRVAPSTTTNNAFTRYVNTGGIGYVGLDSSAGGLTTAYALNLYHSGAYPITFSTSGTERARIDSSGNLLVGKTSAADNAVGVRIAQNGLIVSGRAGGDALAAVRLDSNGDTVTFYRGTSGGSIAQVGSVAVTTVATIYNTTSDYRLKTVIGPVANAGQRIDALQPVEYTWNVNGERTRGFLAHQFQEVYEGSVTGGKDAVDSEGKPVYQSMQASSAEVIADLVAEIQSLRQRLAALEAK